MKTVVLNDFTKVKECVYDGERYSVRDNGAILRHHRPGMRKRKNDNTWTFGKENTENPYLLISGVRVHRIVATAFHGEPPASIFVVDHIDTNCRNNRPENLRWLTRLENTLKNPVTRKKIEYLCGSIKAFLENPQMLNDLQSNPNIAWMRTVTQEEADNCKKRMSLWAKTKNEPNKTASTVNYKSAFNKRVHKPLQKWEAGIAGEPGLDFALTDWCAKYAWIGEPYFPSCPKEFGSNPLNDYFQNIKTGALLSYCDNDEDYPQLYVLESVILRNKFSILVLCERIDSKWSIIGIELNEKNHFIHFHLGSFSSKSKAEIEFNKKQGSSNFWREGYFNKWNV